RDSLHWHGKTPSFCCGMFPTRTRAARITLDGIIYRYLRTLQRNCRRAGPKGSQDAAGCYGVNLALQLFESSFGLGGRDFANVNVTETDLRTVGLEFDCAFGNERERAIVKVV